MSDFPDDTPPNDSAAGDDRAETAPADRDLILDLNFVPDWARKPADDSGFVVREQKPRGKPGGHKGGRPGGKRQNRGDGGPRPPRRDGEARRPGGAPSSGQRPNGPNRQGQGRPGPGRPDGRQGSPRGNSGRPQRPHRPSGPPRPPITIRFVPDDQQLAVVLKKLRAGRRAYPLQDITALFLRHPDTCRALIQIESKDADHKLTQCTECGAVANDPKTMQTHLLNKHIGGMFTEETIEAEPPKGNFVCIRKCGLSNELLGPPNHNSTEARIRELHATRYADMPIDRYRERIKTLHDDALIEQWKDQWRKQKVYRLTSDIEAAQRAASSPDPTASAPEPDAEADATHAAPTEDEAPGDSDVAVHAPETGAPEQEVPADTAATAEDSPATDDKTDTAAENAATEDTEETAAAAPEASADTAETDLSAIETYTWSEASEMFLGRNASKMTRRTFRATVPAGMACQLEDGWLRDSSADAWRRECRSPRSLVFAIRGAFKHRKMHVFKVGKQMEFVTAVPPMPLAPEQAVESIGEVLRYLQDHPGCTRQVLVEGLRPGGSQDKALADEILGPLGWMVERGHIIEFFDGTLSVPRGPAGRKKPAPNRAAGHEKKDAVDASQAASTPESSGDAPKATKPSAEEPAEVPSGTATDATASGSDAVASDTASKPEG